MTFYGRAPEPTQPRPYRRFAYRIYDGGQEHQVAAHQIYFYEHGRVGFWNDTNNDERVLVLSTKAFQVREITGKDNA